MNKIINLLSFYPLPVLLMIFSAAFSSCSGKMKEADVSPAVKSAFSSLYPQAKDVVWEKENTFFEASFTQIEKEITLVFDAGGTVTETEIVIEITTLPPSVLDYIKTSLENKPVNEAAEITDAAGNRFYEAEIDGVDYLFDATGNFIRKKDKEDDDGEDDD
jgi:hypothetical protein